MATIKKVKKAMMGTKEGPGPKKTVMQKLKMKYPDVDTTAKGDVRGSEMNSGAPKKVLQKYNDTYNAFEKKFGNKPAMKMGGKMKKAKEGTSLGMKSVKAGFDKNPGVTRADVIVAAKGQAKKGKMVKKAMAKKAPMMAKAPMSSPMMKKGGKMTKKCAYGCK
jgi:hypothetical protein